MGKLKQKLKNKNKTENIKTNSANATKLQSKTISKRTKRKHRHDKFVQKVNDLHEIKHQIKKQNKRRNAIIGDTSALFDALPSIESLIKNRNDRSSKTIGKKITNVTKKPIPKVSKQKKNMLTQLDVFKKLMNNKQLKQNKDPIRLVTEHVMQRIQSGEL